MVPAGRGLEPGGGSSAFRSPGQWVFCQKEEILEPEISSVTPGVPAERATMFSHERVRLPRAQAPLISRFASTLPGLILYSRQPLAADAGILLDGDGFPGSPSPIMFDPRMRW